MFHIFANQASLSADTNGNLAVKILNGSNDFGTRGDSYNLTSGDIYYIQQLAKNLQSNAFRNKTFNHVVLGKDVNVSIENNKVLINGITMDNLKPEGVYQDTTEQTYINFSDVFQQLVKASTSYTSTPQTKDVISNYSDMNNRYIDVSGVAAGTQIIYVNVPFEYLSYPQPITIKGISNSLTGPTIVINVTGIPDGNQNISTQVQLNYIDGTNALPNSEGHTEPNHVLWNLGTGGQTFNFISGRFMGSILAPNATINAGVNIDGNIVANVVNITGGESHRWDIHPQPTQPTQPIDPNDPTKGYVPPTPENPTEDTPITYEKDTQKATVTYVVEGTGTVLHTDNLEGKSGEPIEYSTVAKLADLKALGYDLVTDGFTTATDNNFDKDTKVDQSFVVTVKPHVKPIKPVDPENPNDPNKPKHGNIKHIFKNVEMPTPRPVEPSQPATPKYVEGQKELPNTGTEDNASLAALGLLGVLSGFGLVDRKKKED